MDLQETLKEEWRQMIASMIIGGTLQEVKIPNENVNLVRFANGGGMYFKINTMYIYGENKLVHYLSLPTHEDVLFGNYKTPEYISIIIVKSFFTNIRNTYSANELQKLLLLTIHEFYDDLRETHLQLVEMVLRDCYLMKYMQKY
jgi:hypothetical protein